MRDGARCLEVVLNQEEVILRQPLSEAMPFVVSWVHSVEREEWRERFRIEGERVILTETRFKTFGAGVPDSAPETRLEDGWVVMGGFERPVDPYVIRAGETTAHAIELGTRRFALSEGQYLIRVRRPCRGRSIP